MWERGMSIDRAMTLLVRIGLKPLWMSKNMGRESQVQNMPYFK